MRTMSEPGRVVVDDAELYYEVRGSGPVLLIVQGGASDAGATELLVAALAHRFRVVTYDRRGLSRSSSGGGTVTVSTHADDAARVLDEVSAAPARVYGVSIGALIGLHLAVVAPGRVSTLVAHEPPMPSVVRDVDRERVMDQVEATFRRDGPAAAVQAMAALVGATPGAVQCEAGARPTPPVGDAIANFQRFFAHDFPAVRSSSLAVEAVAAVRGPVVIPTGGVLSRGRWEYRCAEVLSIALGRALTEMPGGHNGPVTHPRATATALEELLA
ncbi:alpha/beta fold hydrolase [Pseudonocardia sp. H11422]|uniref:alpha/beta fold hydrolase n=1 Tax=Pseudonocardia sp. H11422 TaxID=2835866 RepID=UPI002027F20B|nr:alpha/beta hydrolase [Pseudonocardia sp. H11422]